MLVRKSKSKEFFRWLLSKPARMIVGSFLLIIMMGFVLLLLPLSSADGRSVGPLKAIFTSVSATCVTGLVLSDTALTYSSFGRSVVIGLIQIGGLGLVTITTFFLTIVRRRVGLKTRLLAQESSGSFTFMELPSLLKSIVVMTLSFELLGMLVFATQFVPLFGWRAGLSKSAFHAVSSFCNAGFDLMGDTSFGPYSSMTGFADNPVVLLMTSFLIIDLLPVVAHRREGRREGPCRAPRPSRGADLHRVHRAVQAGRHKIGCKGQGAGSWVRKRFLTLSPSHLLTLSLRTRRHYMQRQG